MRYHPFYANCSPKTGLRVHFICRKFGLELNDKLESAGRCSSFLTEKEYQEKCLSGEIVGFVGVDKNEIESPKPVMVDCQYCSTQYDITLYRRCPNCGASKIVNPNPKEINKD